MDNNLENFLKFTDALSRDHSRNNTTVQELALSQCESSEFIESLPSIAEQCYSSITNIVYAILSRDKQKIREKVREVDDVLDSFGLNPIDGDYEDRLALRLLYAWQALALNSHLDEALCYLKDTRTMQAEYEEAYLNSYSDGRLKRSLSISLICVYCHIATVELFIRHMVDNVPLYTNDSLLGVFKKAIESSGNLSISLRLSILSKVVLSTAFLVTFSEDFVKN